MISLVTTKEAMDFLRYDEEPPELELLIMAGSAAVLNYLGEDAGFLEVESDNEDYPPVPPEVKAACLIWMGEMDQNREGAQPVVRGVTQSAFVDPRFGYGYPPAAVVALLSSLRRPRMA